MSGMKEKLKRLLAKYGQTQGDLADMLGITYQSVSIKLNGKSEFTLSELFTIVQVFNLTPEEVYDIFFSVDSRFEAIQPSHSIAHSVDDIHQNHQLPLESNSTIQEQAVAQ